MRGYLTKTESEVLYFLAKYGMGTKQIGDELHMAQNTVREHIENAGRKKRLHGQVEIVAWAWRSGWLLLYEEERRLRRR